MWSSVNGGVSTLPRTSERPASVADQDTAGGRGGNRDINSAPVTPGTRAAVTGARRPRQGLLVTAGGVHTPSLPNNTRRASGR